MMTITTLLVLAALLVVGATALNVQTTYAPAQPTAMDGADVCPQCEGWYELCEAFYRTPLGPHYCARYEECVGYCIDQTGKNYEDNKGNLFANDLDNERDVVVAAGCAHRPDRGHAVAP